MNGFGASWWMVAPYHGTDQSYFWVWARDYVEDCPNQLVRDRFFREGQFTHCLTFSSPQHWSIRQLYSQREPSSLWFVYALGKGSGLLEPYRNNYSHSSSGFCISTGPGGEPGTLISCISQWLSTSFSLFRRLRFEYLLTSAWRSTVISPQRPFQAELYLPLS